MKKKKVLFIITKSNWGGAQRYVYDLATSLDKTRFEPVVALGGTGLPGAAPGLLYKKLADAQVRTVVVGSFMRDISLAKEFGALRELMALFKKERPDIVHLNSSKAGGLGAFAARLAGVPKIIFTAHGWPFLEERPLWWRAGAWLGSWTTALLATTVITVSDNDMHTGGYLPFCRHKVHRIHNGIAPMTFGPGQIIRSAFPTGVKITGTVGELTANKNQVALIEQAKNNPSMYVAIVGDGELHSYLAQKIKECGLEDRVKLFGFVPAAEALKGFDIFALPSKKEGLPYVLLEAKQAGLPIEASRVGGIPDIIDAPDMSEFTLEKMVAKTQALY